MRTKRSTPPLLVGVKACIALWKSIWWLLRKLKLSIPQDTAIAHMDTYTKDAQSYHKALTNYVHSSLISNRQNQETTYLSLN